MDIVGRIKTFLNEKNLTVSQFADGCEISRPTMSQLLNGRNKKVSDEVISKIHTAFPALSINWLLFGEGDMILSNFVETAQPRENSIFDKLSEDNENPVNLAGGLFADEPANVSTEKATAIPTSQVASRNVSHPAVKIETVEVEKPKRSVTKIIVYYSDNSFEEFVPR